MKSYLKPVISTAVNCLQQKYAAKPDSFVPGQRQTTFFKAEGIFSEAREVQDTKEWRSQMAGQESEEH